MLKAEGRMIRTDISTSEKIAKLSPKALALFCMLIPHFNAHGKMPAGAGHIKDIVCPLIDWLPEKAIPALLKEISRHTSVKYFKDEKGLPYLHSLSWTEHQELRAERMGPDRLPNYSRTTPGLNASTPGLLPGTPGLLPGTPGLLPPEVEGKVEGEVEGEVLCSVGQNPTEPTIAPALKSFLIETEYLKLASNGDSVQFWESLTEDLKAYSLGPEWLFKKLRLIEQWQVDNPGRASRTPKGMRQRIRSWIDRDTDKMTRRKTYE